MKRGGCHTEENNVARSNLPLACSQFYPSHGQVESKKITYSGSLGSTLVPFYKGTHSVRTATLICAAALVC